jgi:hypothetical protein
VAGNKKDNITIIYTPASNLKVTPEYPQHAHFDIAPFLENR